MKVLIIDDQFDRHQGYMDVFNAHYPDWEIHQAWNVVQALGAFEQHAFGLVFFDHDLGFGQESGSWIAYEVLSRPGKYKCPGRAFIHTANYTGGRNIAAKLHSAGVPHYQMDWLDILRDLKDRADFEQMLAEMPQPPMSE